MIAELNGKISSSASNLSDRLEDQLTGDVFGSLRYISFDKVMKKILERSNILGNDFSKVVDIISNMDIEYWDENIKFWPYNSNAELDIILEFKDIVIGIEVKLYSGISSDDSIEQIDDDVENEVKEESINQLARESRVLSQIIEHTNKLALLLFIAPENRCKKISTGVYNRRIIKDKVELGYISWEEILEAMKEIKKEKKLNRYEQLIINDIISLLKRKGLERFKSFNFEYQDIDVRLFFNFQEKIHKTLEFNYDEIIEREFYYEFR